MSIYKQLVAGAAQTDGKISEETKAGLVVPFQQTKTILQAKFPTLKVRSSAVYYMCGVLQFLAEEIIHEGDVHASNRKSAAKFTPRDVKAALAKNKELAGATTGVKPLRTPHPPKPKSAVTPVAVKSYPEPKKSQ